MDEQEFTRLVREQKETIYTVCYMFSDNPDEVSDLFQETLVNLWRGFRRFRGESSVRTYVWRIALNTCINADGRKKRRQKHETPYDMRQLEPALFEGGTEQTKQARMLHGRIRKLGFFDRAIVLLWLEDLSYEEIGAIVGISARNVGVRLFRIKEELKKAVRSENPSKTL
ncbi:MAG: sigma-70 family RNA polymerase sigma factor [Bacteroides sp.]|nr:sigma-70 family RNA polymerase sigma factor [Bacteroides sp.]MCM1085167.1 sigma-70 family RNA polymerase sigma factor [Bacteroides sp.]